MNGDAKKHAMQARLHDLAAGGRLTADAVVADAESPRSPLHDQFEWDDSAAAHRFRVDQARGLISSFRVFVELRTHTVAAPAFVRDPEAGPKEQGYRETVSLKTDRDRARDALLTEAGRAAAYLERVRALAVALDLGDEMGEVFENFAVFRRAVEDGRIEASA